MNQQQILMSVALVATLTLLATGMLPVAGVVILAVVVIGGAIVLLTLPGIQVRRPRHRVWLALVAGGLLLLTSYFGILPSQADPGLRGWLLVAGAGLALVAAAHAPARRTIGRVAITLAVIAAIVFLLGGRQQVGERIGQLAEWRWRPATVDATAKTKEVKIVLASNGKASFDLGAWVAKNPRHRFWEVFAPETVQITLPNGSGNGHYQGSGIILFSGKEGEEVHIVFRTSGGG